jgi:large subunit ribosomal protein L33
MAKAKAREYMWLQCSDCSALNYRTSIRTAGGTPKIQRKKFCPAERKHTLHKLKRK